MAVLRSDNLSRVMLERGWNQSDLSRVTGFNRQYISRVLNGKMKPSAEFVIRIMAILPGYDQDEFFLPEVLLESSETGKDTYREASHA